MNARISSVAHAPPRRKGAALVEITMILPPLFLVIFVFIEFDRFLMSVHATEEAARVGCRQAILSSATQAEVEDEVKQALDPFGIKKYTLTVTPSLSSSMANGTPVTVSIKTKYDDLSWLPSPEFLTGKFITSSSTLPKEE